VIHGNVSGPFFFLSPARVNGVACFSFFFFFAFRRAEEEVTRARAKRSRWDVHLNVTTLLFYFGSLMAPGWWGTVLCK